MAHLIDKDVLVAEIERLKDFYNRFQTIAKYNVLVDILSFLDAFEVNDADLDFTKEVDMWIRDNGDTNGFFNVQELAKHFFELGLRAQK